MKTNYYLYSILGSSLLIILGAVLKLTYSKAFSFIISIGSILFFLSLIFLIIKLLKKSTR